MFAKGLRGVYLKLMRLKHLLKKFNHDKVGKIGKLYHEAQSRKNENRIVSFTTDNGITNDNFHEVVKHFVDHFKGFMGSSSKTLTGLDDYGSGFFKAVWTNIGAEICGAINEFFTSVDYRLIACCTTLYKCISKLMCNRLAMVLPIIINQNQGAFVQERSIAHNVMILQDVLKNYRRKNASPRCAMKIDIIKAYDTGSYKGAKGLRQGDPISPLLFVLIMEYLTRLLQLAAHDFNYRYHLLCKSLKLINLYFADDLIILSKGTRQSLRIIKAVLDDFSTTTWLFINTQKSHIYFGGGR
ncbi:uncharacterized protein LOC133039152 [Cannabis sativa]|uniref:uncharacterized protein LOC133039152 n=1 Tax=Cannabis sativa TaxID=3483 RepID=UPI0029CA3547|nr:uncharacterized protein LOC133039152 [Cannabis sativa]